MFFFKTIKRLTQFSHSVPGDGVRSYRLGSRSYKTAPPNQFQMPAVSPGCYWCFWPTRCRSEVPVTPLWFDQCIRMAHRTQKNVYLLGYQFIVCVYMCVCVHAHCAHSVVSTLHDRMDCGLPGSSGHGIFQARILEWVSSSFSRGSSQPRDQTLGLFHPELTSGFFTR